MKANLIWSQITLNFIGYQTLYHLLQSVVQVLFQADFYLMFVDDVWMDVGIAWFYYIELNKSFVHMAFEEDEHESPWIEPSFHPI